ncbi:MAG: right-handed parallel beta-helix repeat-containing protein [Bacteroidetes bacterium]|nr:right-handed parallel beta-helix repeat-containing protein [Bacteroidota bacterium]
MCTIKTTVSYDITNNTFAGNNTDLFLDQGSYSNMKITGNTFTNAAGPLTKAPYAGIAPAHHIRLNNVTALEIGGYSGRKEYF